jgi:hypothetical protein
LISSHTKFLETTTLDGLKIIRCDLYQNYSSILDTVALRGRWEAQYYPALNSGVGL